MKCQTRTKQTKARPNKRTAESTGNFSAMKRNQTLYNDVSTISSHLVSRKSLRRPRNAQVIFAEELGTMSKNNLRRITLARGPIWGIHSLNLIISWYNTFIRNYNLYASVVILEYLN